MSNKYSQTTNIIKHGAATNAHLNDPKRAVRIEKRRGPIVSPLKAISRYLLIISFGFILVSLKLVCRIMTNIKYDTCQRKR